MRGAMTSFCIRISLKVGRLDFANFISCFPFVLTAKFRKVSIGPEGGGTLTRRRRFPARF